MLILIRSSLKILILFIFIPVKVKPEHIPAQQLDCQVLIIQ